MADTIMAVLAIYNAYCQTGNTIHMRNKRILITGASGFIAGALIDRVYPNDNNVRLVRQEDYYKPNFKEMLTNYNPHIIIHAGAYGNHSSQTDDLETFEANIVKTFLLLEATKDIPYEAFINIGSSSEYGRKQFPMSEEDILEPQTMYGATKASGTMLSRAFAKKYDKPIVTVRPFSVYGPGEADHRFIPTVIRALTKQEELFLDRLPYHDWIYIDDVIEGILAVIDQADTLKGSAVNIGTGREYRNQEVVSMLELVSGLHTKIIETPMRPKDSTNWVADNRTLRLCGWKPKVQLMDGLRKTYEAYIK